MRPFLPISRHQRWPIGLLLLAFAPCTITCGGDEFTESQPGGSGGTSGTGGASGSGGSSAGAAGSGGVAGSAAQGGIGGSGVAGSNGGSSGTGGTGVAGAAGIAGQAGVAGAAGGGGSPIVPVVEWVTPLSGPESQFVSALDLDPAQRVVVAGHFQSQLLVAPPVSSVGGFDVFVVRLDNQGQHVDAVSFGGAGDEYVTSDLSHDGSGLLFFGGMYKGSGTFGSTTLPAPNDTFHDGFLARLTPSLGVSTVTRMAGPGNQTPEGITARGGFGLLVAGSIGGESTLGGFTMPYAGADDAFILRSFADTNDWARSFGNSLRQYIHSLDISGSQAVAVGESFGTISADGLSCTSSGESDALFVRLSPADGAVSSLACFGDESKQSASGVKVLPDRSAVVVGSFFGTMVFDPIHLVSAGESDVFVVKLNPNDTVAWASSFGAPSVDDEARSVAIDAKGNVYVAGVLRGPVSFAGESFSPNAGGDAFVARYGPGGAEDWMLVFGDDAPQRVDRIAVNDNGEVFAAGVFENTLPVGPGPTLIADGVDGFVLKITQDP